VGIEMLGHIWVSLDVWVSSSVILVSVKHLSLR